jgi:hypothetical protein
MRNMLLPCRYHGLLTKAGERRGTRSGSGDKALI